MRSKNEFDTKSRANDFKSLQAELSERSPDLTRVLPHILGKCFRNAQYNKLAKAELLTLSNKHECLRVALFSIFRPMQSRSSVDATNDTEKLSANTTSIKRLAKL